MSEKHRKKSARTKDGASSPKDGGGGGGGDVSQAELERRRQVAKITPMKALGASDFLGQYEEKYKDSSTEEEDDDNSRRRRRGNSDSSSSDNSNDDDDENANAAADDGLKVGDKKMKKKKKKKKKNKTPGSGSDSSGNDDDEHEQPSKVKTEDELREEREVDELMQMARDLEGAAVIDVRYDKMQQSRAQRMEKRRLDALNEDESCWEAFMRVLCCRPRRGTVPTLKQQRRFLVDVKNQEIPAARRALQNYQPPDFFEQDGKTALYSAAFNGTVGLAHLLMDFDANPEIGDSENGMKPLHVAALNDFNDFIAVLTKRQAKVDCRDNEGRTPLMCASMKGHVDVIITLLDDGANIRATDNRGWTCLHYAAWKGRLLAIERLERAGGFVDARDKLGMSPFDYAVEAGHETAARVLTAMEKGEYDPRAAQAKSAAAPRQRGHNTEAAEKE